MSMIYKLGISTLLICLCQTSLAAVYKCEENGDISFSDKPCKKSAREITKKQYKSIPKTAAEASTSRTLKTKKMADEMETTRVQRDLKRDIMSLEKEIEEMKTLKDTELQALEDKKLQIGVGDNYDDELLAIDLKKIVSDEMTSVENKYSAEIEELNAKIKTMQKQLIQE